MWSLLLSLCQDCRQHQPSLSCFSGCSLPKWKEWVSVLQSKNNTINTYFMCVPASFCCRWGSWIVGVFSPTISGCPSCAVILMGSIYTHPEVQPLSVGKVSLLAPLQRCQLTHQLPSPSFGRRLKLAVGASPWQPPAAATGLFLEAEYWCPAKLDTWHWERRCDPAPGDVMHYRLFPIGGVSCLMLRGGSSHLQGYLAGTASLRAVWKIHFKTSFLYIIISKKWSPAFREWKENFLLKEVLKTVGLLQD